MCTERDYKGDKDNDVVMTVKTMMTTSMRIHIKDDPKTDEGSAHPSDWGMS